MSDRELVVYGRTTFCPYLSIAERVFEKHGLSPRIIMIDEDETALERVVAWTGFKSVPTMIMAKLGDDLPFEEPSPLEPGASPKGIDRGSMITEANAEQLEAWLRKHQVIS
ncbi:MAG: glutaredoxin family protein [Chloroflexi bacterium]|nr:glutaredoxin family protein [Chloroflexota bacterium]